jgi:transcriptional regulator GlxA family with amidase domain
VTVRTIGLVGYEGVNALDFTGPHEAFTSATSGGPSGDPAYRVICLSPDGGSFRSRSGLLLAADMALADAPDLDTLIIPGGPGIREPEILTPLSAWLAGRARSTRRLVSVCTGIFALGEAGLLDGRRATTHWRYASLVANRFPAIRLEPDAIFIRDGSIWTSAGVTAGIDLALA